jgi:hypothetical protein
VTALRTEPRLADPDGFFAALVEAHRGLDDAASRRLDARLVILLANHIGDEAVLREASRWRAQRARGTDHRKPAAPAAPSPPRA